MTETSDGRLTLGSLLFGRADGDAIGRTLRDHRALDGLADAFYDVPAPLRGVAIDRIGHAAAEALGADVVDVLSLGWQKYERLKVAAAKTLAAPGSEEVVDLASHRITSTHETTLEVLVDDVQRAVIELLLDLHADVHAVQAVVSEGRLVALHSGKADLEATLSCNGVEVQVTHGTIDLDFELDLAPRLVPPTAQPTSSGSPHAPA